MRPLSLWTRGSGLCRKAALFYTATEILAMRATSKYTPSFLAGQFLEKDRHTKLEWPESDKIRPC
jgi:hypothetical protein